MFSPTYSASTSEQCQQSCCDYGKPHCSFTKPHCDYGKPHCDFVSKRRCLCLRSRIGGKNRDVSRLMRAAGGAMSLICRQPCPVSRYSPSSVSIFPAHSSAFAGHNVLKPNCAAAMMFFGPSSTNNVSAALIRSSANTRLNSL